MRLKLSIWKMLDEDGQVSSLSVVLKQLQAPDRLAELVDEEMKNLKKLPHEVLRDPERCTDFRSAGLEQLVESVCRFDSNENKSLKPFIAYCCSLIQICVYFRNLQCLSHG